MIINTTKKGLSMTNKNILYIVGGIGILYFLVPKTMKSATAPKPVQGVVKPSLFMGAPVIPDIYADAWKSPADIQAEENSYYIDSWQKQ